MAAIPLPTLQSLTIDFDRAPADWFRSWQPLAFVDLNSCPEKCLLETLPSFPLIGLGNASHPVAHRLDCCVESPISARSLVENVHRAPRAASVLAQLLRTIGTVTPTDGLILESSCYGLLQGSAEHSAWLAARPASSTSVSTGELIVERRDDTLLLTLDRPRARNAIDRSLRDQLGEAFTVATFDSSIRTIRLRANGACFSIGGDLDEFGTTRDPATAHLIRCSTLPAALLGGRAAMLDVHVGGACIGAGLELAAFAQRITATLDAWFQLPEIAMGLIPGAGGCVSVPRRIGRQRAALMILSGRRISATTALSWGLIDAIVDHRPR